MEGVKVGDHVVLVEMDRDILPYGRSYQFLYRSPEIWEVIGRFDGRDTGIILDLHGIFAKILTRGRIGWIATANLQVIP